MILCDAERLQFQVSLQSCQRLWDQRKEDALEPPWTLRYPAPVGSVEAGSVHADASLTGTQAAGKGSEPRP